MVLPPHPNPTAPVLSHFSLAGKTAIVTGGCRGIGLEAARALVEAGANVAITYTTTKPEVAQRIAGELAQYGDVIVKAYQCDVTSKTDVETVIERAAQELGGRLDVCVANAGIAGHVAAIDYSEDDWKKMLDVNFNGAFWTAQAAARIFERQLRAEVNGGRASIIFTASVSGILVNVPQKQAAYNASKAAVIHLAKSLAVEWIDFARVNCVSPGFISTDSES